VGSNPTPSATNERNAHIMRAFSITDLGQPTNSSSIRFGVLSMQDKVVVTEIKIREIDG
jgi:hypothetical protein